MELTVTISNPIAMVYGSLREKYAYVNDKKHRRSQAIVWWLSRLGTLVRCAIRSLISN
ncbi:hypothetical protein OENI_950001 [Oenococcus oeni]|nr:hypothetical protein OENI_950001 [Oenococcus oeni]